MTEAERLHCRVTARWLAACGRPVGALGLGLAGVAALALLLTALPGAGPRGLAPAELRAAHLPTLALAATLLLALPERVLALRLAFDAGLFTDLALPRHAAPAPAARLAALDEGLHLLGLRPATAQPRPLHARIAGARRLARQHLAVVGAQATTLGLGLALLAAAGQP